MPRILAPVLLAAMCGLSACATATGPVEVTRFHRAADGIELARGSVVVVPAPAAEGAPPADPQSLETGIYLAAVARELQRIGYNEIAGGGEYLAEVRVERSNVLADGRRSPVSVGVGGSTGGYRSGVGVGVGINLGSLGGGGPRIATELSARILRADDRTVVWEGRAVQEARAGTPASQPGIAAAKLASALFEGFPGRSGETIEVK